MARIRHGLEKFEWSNIRLQDRDKDDQRQIAFQQLMLATRGNEDYNEHVAAVIQRLDYIVNEEKNGSVPESEKGAWNFYFQDIGREIGEWFWQAKKSKDGAAFRQIARMVERDKPNKPDWQFAAYIKLQVANGRITAVPPVAAMVKLFNETLRKLLPGIPKTSYVQMDRICKELRLVTPKVKRKPRGPKAKVS